MYGLKKSKMPKLAGNKFMFVLFITSIVVSYPNTRIILFDMVVQVLAAVLAKMSRRNQSKISPVEQAKYYVRNGMDRDGLEKRQVNEVIGECSRL